MGSQIIVNGKKLNFIQKRLFEKSTEQINKLFQVFYYVGIMGFLLTSILLFKTSVIYTAALILAMLFWIDIFHIFKENNIFIYQGYPSVAAKGEIEGILKKSWIVNEDMIKQLMTVNARTQINTGRFDMLKNSFGHRIFNALKEVEFEYRPDLISSYENPDKEFIKFFMDKYYQSHRGYVFKAPATFQGQTREDLEKYYASYSKVSHKDKFALKAISKMKDKELIMKLDKGLVVE